MGNLLQFLREKRNRNNLIVIAVLILIIPVGILLTRTAQVFNPRASVDPIVFTGSNVETIDGKKVLTAPEVTLQLTSKLGGVAPSPTPTPGGDIVCAQVVTRACEIRNPQSCRDFPTPCDVPKDWSPAPLPPENSRKFAIKGKVFTDSNNNASRESGEPPKEGITVTLSGGDLNKTYISNSEGNYEFVDLSPGRYTVGITVPPGSRVTTSNNVTVEVNNQDITQQDFGLSPQSQSWIQSIGGLLASLMPVEFSLASRDFELVKEVEAQAPECDEGTQGDEDCTRVYGQGTKSYVCNENRRCEPAEDTSGGGTGGNQFGEECPQPVATQCSANGQAGTYYCVKYRDSNGNCTLLGPNSACYGDQAKTSSLQNVCTVAPSVTSPSTGSSGGSSAQVNLDEVVENCKGERKTLRQLKQELVSLGWNYSISGPLDTKDQILNGYNSASGCINGVPSSTKIQTCNGPKTIAEMTQELRNAGYNGSYDSGGIQDAYKRTVDCSVTAVINSDGTVTTCKEQRLTVAQLDTELRQAGYDFAGKNLQTRLRDYNQAACPLGKLTNAVSTCKVPLGLGGPRTVGALMTDLRAANFPDQGFRNTTLEQAIIAYNAAQPECNSRPTPPPTTPTPTPGQFACTARDFSGVDRKLVVQQPLTNDPLMAKICADTGQGANCAVDVVSQFKGYDTEKPNEVGYNTMIVITKGKLWWVTKLFDSSKPNTLPIDGGNIKRFQLPGTTLFRYVMVDGDPVENFGIFKPICDEGKRLGGGSYPEGYCRVTEYSHFKGYDDLDVNSPTYNTALIIGYGKYVWLSKIGVQGGDRLDGRRVFVQGAVTDIPEFNEICKNKPASDRYCVIETYNQYKGYDSEDTSDLLYNSAMVTGYGKLLVVSDTSKQGGERLGSRRVLIKGNLADIAEYSKICSCGTGACTLNNISHFKDWDTEDTNSSFITGFGWYWIFDKLASAELQPPSKPTVQVNCNNQSVVQGATINWTGTSGKANPSDAANRDKRGFYVDLSENEQFPNFDVIYNKFVEGLTTDTRGFRLAGGPNSGQSLTVTQGKTYYVRVYNGKHSQVTPFTAVCGSPTPTPTLTPTPTPSLPSSATPSATPRKVYTVSYKVAESRDGLQGAASIPYASEPSIVNYVFADKKAGPKFIFVEFTASDGTKDIQSAQIELVEKPPVISSVSCSTDLNDPTLVKIGIKGERFGSEKGSVHIGNTNLRQESWTDSEVKALYQDNQLRDPKSATSSAVVGVENINGRFEYTVKLARKDGRTVSEKCIVGTTQLSLGAQLFCRDRNNFAINDVDMVLVRVDDDGRRSANKQRKKVTIAPDGYIQNLNDVLEVGKTYEVSLKAPRSLRRVAKFTASSGTTNITNFILPVGDIAPLPNGDGAINTLDKGELNSEWVIASPSANIRPGDFNQDTRVNAVDWACMRYDFGSSNQPEP